MEKSDDTIFGSILTDKGIAEFTKEEFDHLMFLLAEDLALEESAMARNLKGRLEQLR